MCCIILPSSRSSIILLMAKTLHESSEQTDARAEATPPAKKGRATPKRKVAQQQGIRPLVPADRKASAKRARAQLRTQRDSEYNAMRNGDLAHMPKFEQMPARIYIRDYVDARWNLLDYAIPVAYAILFVTFATNYFAPVISLPLMIALTVYIIACIIDTIWMWKRIKRNLIAKFGEAAVAKQYRLRSYMYTRAFTIRRWRLPRPRHQHRGHWPA